MYLTPLKNDILLRNRKCSYCVCPAKVQDLRIWGDVNWYTEKKARSFIHRCALTSRRISRLILQLQEYDLRVKHIRGARNFLADAISRNPAGMSEKEINRLTRPRGLVASAVDFEVESSVRSKLRELHIFQAKDPKSSEVIRAI